MRHYRLQKTQYHCDTVNVERLWSMMDVNAQTFYAANTEKLPILDITRLGFSKVLGSGKPLGHPMVVRAREFSKLGREKIEAAGGSCEVMGLTPVACGMKA